MIGLSSAVAPAADAATQAKLCVTDADPEVAAPSDEAAIHLTVSTPEEHAALPQERCVVHDLRERGDRVCGGLRAARAGWHADAGEHHARRGLGELQIINGSVILLGPPYLHQREYFDFDFLGEDADAPPFQTKPEKGC
jgi:hypothetical protein